MRIEPLRESKEERNIGLIGRLLCALSSIAMLGLFSAVAVAAPSPVTHVTWHGGGLVTWERVEHRAIAPKTIVRLTLGVEPGHAKVIERGASGLLEVRIRYAQRDGGTVHPHVLAASVLRPAKPRVIVEGIGATPLSSFEERGVLGMALMARNAIEMLATGYTADCPGCGGMTAIGRRAGHGIVAVDPRVIPLGTHLYIPGYGIAIAGDTGSDIVGRRIDLGFDSWRDAMLFGRRDIKVYRL
ncbi:MAG: G5 domain-containing protein [Candidatus Eremiobacteraeota bacterium]|nr:G5 domain-containing protein [Candidatus Eremiobacteraeota bacterium]